MLRNQFYNLWSGSSQSIHTSHTRTYIPKFVIFDGNCNELHIIVCLKHGLLPPQMSNSLLKIEFIIYSFYIFFRVTIFANFPLTIIRFKEINSTQIFCISLFLDPNGKFHKRWSTSLPTTCTENHTKSTGYEGFRVCAQNIEILDFRLVSPNRKLCSPFNDSTSTE